MAEDSKIEWTDHTVNLWWGCTKVHQGCDNCYAERLSKRWGNDVWGNDTPRKRIKSAFTDLDKYQRQAELEGVNKKIFVGSMMDVFEKSRPLLNPTDEFKTTNDLRFQLFKNIDNCQYNNLIFLFLTKRPSNINKMILTSWTDDEWMPPVNVWFGASVVDYESMMDVSRHLSKVDGNTFWSVEPLLEEISLQSTMKGHKLPDWLIVGGESGPNKRPFSLKWAKTLREDCEEFEIPFFFKQIDKQQRIPDEMLIREFPIF